jgi:beta-glucanase (GH16 family)
MDITKFHDYAIVWKPDLVEWQIDGKPYMRLTDPARVPHEPMYWVMNAWVGGWGGTPVPETIFPARIEVDYFRVSRLDKWLAEPAIQIDRPKKKYATKDTITVEIADFDTGARVEVWEGGELLQTMSKAPFRYEPKALSRAAHALRFVGTDGVRTATTSLEITIY